MNKVIRIGTRDSQLALWQAHTVENQLQALGYKTQIVPVKSVGDLKLDTPLYELGITGIFTKTLDVAMLNNTVDIAVHSLKDVPTALPKGIVQAAVLKRASTLDILVTKEVVDYKMPLTIATGSLRRKAQWLHKYPTHTVVDLRGNVNTRLQKLQDNSWQGAIFAKAGLERIDVLPSRYTSHQTPPGNGFDTCKAPVSSVSTRLKYGFFLASQTLITMSGRSSSNKRSAFTTSSGKRSGPVQSKSTNVSTLAPNTP